MGVLFILLALGGDTLTLTNGEIFVGKVLAQNEQRVWLKIENGGVLTFTRDRIATLDAAERADPAPAPAPVRGNRKSAPAPVPENHKSAPAPAAVAENRQSAPAPAAVPQPPKTVPPFAEPAKKPGVETAPAIAAVPGKDAVHRGLKCPVGFQEDPAPPPPFACVFNEPATGARMTLRAEFFDEGRDEAVRKTRAEIGAGLVAEQELRLRAAGIDARLFESEVEAAGETRGELLVVFVRDGVLFKLGGGVGKNQLEAYRDLFLDAFAEFKPEPPDRSAGASRAAAAPNPPPGEEPR
ncbi:MAG TPA: hypothetical protein PKX48_01625 [Planctomycetota bacterium]|jgi:hypothetical protein|nr:hypothetical protein [Planctomycetota bacterium]OQC22118.1 MAG: hypothetical protein BWX69_00429 [Planctomycetes bacterium ADurb.Bin069]HNS00378.1 hypothetical protein [Planctomycetota bacterium]HNU25748.1 hypothetical protein [Planctomycetota bacterium]HOE28698.1 hypothetical protein [Planctomycetota bacterium]